MRGARVLLAGGVAIGLFAASASQGGTQAKPDAIDQVLQNGAPASGPAAAPGKLKPRESPALPPDQGPAAASVAESAQDQDNPEVQSAAPSSRAAAARPAEPLKRPRYAVAVLQALDKVTAETVRFEAPVNQPVRYKTLIFTVHACETTAPDELQQDAIAHVEIDSQPKGPEGGAQPAPRQVFRGWMYASSPGLDLFQNPIYDAWLIACKTAAPSA